MIYNGRYAIKPNTSVGWLAKIYIHQLWADTEYRLKNLPRAMADKGGT